MFVRISIDQIVDMSDFASLATTGEIAGVQQTSL
jgi:hypothetical protein